MKEAFLKYAVEVENLTDEQADAEWKVVEADMNTIRDEEDRREREHGEGTEHWFGDGTPRCPLGFDAESDECDNCERRCPHNGLSHLRFPISEQEEIEEPELDPCEREELKRLFS